MKGDEDSLTRLGIADESINMCEKVVIMDDDDEKNAEFVIRRMCERYFCAEKDELLNKVKIKRKSFINQFAVKLKTLNFKKKNNTWTKLLEGQYYLMFNIQKSAFSDEYYFNIYIGKNGTNRYGDCFYARIAPQNMCPMDWQSITKEQFDEFMQEKEIAL